MIHEIRKRDGTLVRFSRAKIAHGILKSLEETKTGGRDDAEMLTGKVIQMLGKVKGSPWVEDVQKAVERVLVYEGYEEAAKAYMNYRMRGEELRALRSFIDVKDDLKLGVNAMSVLKERYLLRNERGVLETPSQMFRRVARAVASVERNYGKGEKAVREIEEQFYSIMSSLDFLPNSPCLMNAGTPLGQLAACFVLPVEDSLEGIFDSVKHAAIIHQSGGGTGFSFSRLRPRGDTVKSTFGVASGPVSFMKVFNEATEVIKQGGRRRGANMSVLRVDHPDILDFIRSKDQGGLDNFNISVAITKSFMRALYGNKEYGLVNPRDGKAVRKLKAREVFDFICASAWRTGDPGVVFIDKVNEQNPTPRIGEIEATNPCAEEPLLPYESCNLGSINLSKYVNNGKPVWERLRETVTFGVRFLDDIIDANVYPLPPIERMAKANRKVGLGVMGFAEFLIKLGIPYDSDDGVKMGEKVMGFVWKEAVKASEELAEERGNFPNFHGSLWERKGHVKMRNATLTTVAPTGTVSIIAGCSSGIEPLFAVSFVRNVMEGAKLVEVNPLFESIARERGFYSEALMMEITRTGSIQRIKGIPSDVKSLFVTALDIEPEWHVKVQAAFQKFSDSAVSKTVNLPETATVEDVKKVFMLAYKLGCKGITVYRYGSKPNQVLTIGEHVTASSEYSGGCTTIDCHF